MMVWGIKDRRSAKKKPALYKRWWAIIFYLLVVAFLTIVGTFILTEEVVIEKSTESTNYTWTDENGVVHFSDSKKSSSAKEVAAPKTPFEKTKERIIYDFRRAVIFVSDAIKSRKKELSIAAVIAVIAAFLGIGIRKGYRFHKAKKLRIQKEESVKGFIDGIKEFHSTLNLAMNKKDYHMKLFSIRTPLEKYMENWPDIEDRHQDTLELLQKVLQSYTDGTVLWNINSHEELVWADKNGYFIKYPELLGLIRESKPLKQPMNKIVRSTIWKYASKYLKEAEAVFSGSHTLEN